MSSDEGLAAAPPNDAQRADLLPPKPSRRTTKRFFLLCQAACFGTLWLAILHAPETVQWLAGPAFLAAVGFFAAYTGSGTLDLRAMALAMGASRPGGRVSQRWGGGDGLAG